MSLRSLNVKKLNVTSDRLTRDKIKRDASLASPFAFMTLKRLVVARDRLSFKSPINHGNNDFAVIKGADQKALNLNMVLNSNSAQH
jgi:hypothetical protein